MKNSGNEENLEQTQQVKVFTKRFFGILSFIGVSASLVGFLIIISIIGNFRAYQVLINPHGLIVGILLLGGGMILLISLIFLNQSSSFSSSSNSSISDQNDLKY
jgi:hypothetical protein